MSSTEETKVLRGKVVALIQSLLLSSKGGVPLDRLFSDYKSIVGEGIPYRKLGHTSLEEFVDHARDVCRISYGSSGQVMLHAVTTERTAHIASMVASQRSTKKKPKPVSRRPFMQRTWQPPAESNRGRSGARGGGNQRFHQRQPVIGSGRLPSHNNSARGVASGRARGGLRQNGQLRAPQNGTSVKIGTFHVNTKPNNLNNNNNRNNINANNTRNNNNNNNNNKLASQSSPNSKKTPKEPSRNYVGDLEKYYDVNNLGKLEFKTAEMGTKKNRFVSTVIVKGKTFQTFPHEFPSQELAEQEAARQAIEKLGISNEDNLVSKKSSDVNFDINGVIDRIVDIVGSRSNGVWSTRIDVEYKGKFKEELPAGWPDMVIPARHKLRVDSPIAGRYIVVPCLDLIPDGSGDVTSSNDEKTASSKSELSNENKMLPKLILPSEKYWEIYVTIVTNTSSITVRLLGENYQDKFEDLCTEMELHYFDLDKIPPVASPAIGRYYAAKLDSDWHRVKITRIDSDVITCYFVDHGDVDDLKLSDLREIHEKFLTLPAQAKEISLAGLEDLSDDENATSLLRNAILGRSLAAEVTEGSSLIVYDVSDKTKDVNINKKILEELSGEDGETCGLPVGGEKIPVYLSYISNNGDVFVQRENSTLQLIDKLIDENSERIGKSETPKNDSLDTEKTYIARYQLNNQLYRAALLTDQVKDGKVLVHFLDYGNDEVVSLDQIREAGSVSKLLDESPSQALKCRLANVLPSPCHQWTFKTAEKLRSMIPEDKQVFLKVESSSADGVPEVEIFEQDSVESVNKTLSSNPDLFEENKDLPSVEEVTPELVAEAMRQAAANLQSNNTDPEAELMFPDLASLKSLVPPFIPNKGEFFDITVTLAASPSNFTVQSWNDEAALELQQLQMNEFYGRSGRQKFEVKVDDLEKDSFFVAIHDDNYWYRVKVGRVLDNESVAVKFVDYGDYSMIKLCNLQPLWPQFRNLPMQAIKASLADIIPTHGDWTPDDTVWFNQRVVDKQFVSLIKDVVMEDDSVKIGVSLIDVEDPKKDVMIEKILVEDKRAVFLCI